MAADELVVKNRGKVSRRRLVTVAGLLIFFILALEAAISKSPTADEGMHMLRGSTLWQTGSLELQGQHTPLSHWLIGALHFTESSLPEVEQLPSWPSRSPDKLVQELLWQSGIDVSRFLLLSRLPIIFFALIVGAVLARWADRQFGFLALTATMVFFAFSPNFLASSALATTDLVAAATFTMAILMVWSYWQKPNTFRWLLAGALIGLGLSAKLTGILLLPISLLLSYVNEHGSFTGEISFQRFLKPGLIWLSWLIIAFIVLWAVYGFEIGTGSLLPIPAATYVSNFTEVQQHIDRGHFAYLFGERSNQGWWYYFLLTFGIKTPLVLLVFMVLALIFVIRFRMWRKSFYLWMPVLVIMAAASFSGLNIGYRHILPVLPLVWLFIALVVQTWYPALNRRRLVIAGLALYAVLSLRQTPHFLAYFNELVGGSGQGYRYLGDSNIDWGQDLGELSRYVNNNTDLDLFVSYFGPSDPSYYGLDIDPLIDDQGQPQNFAPANPSPGRYLISVNHWQGATEKEPDLFSWFRNQRPIDNIGYSILIYDVERSLEGKWIGRCSDPDPLIEEDLAAELVGMNDVRQFIFECRQSWVLPSGGIEPGWLVVPADYEPSIPDSLFPGALSVVYENHSSPNSKPYKIYHWSGTAEAAAKLDQISGSVEVAGKELNLPIAVGGVAHFLGAASVEGKWISAWGAHQNSNLPLSVKMHSISEDGQRFVGDGLGFNPSQWQTGDIFIQYLPDSNESGQFLETGLYNYITAEELLLEDTGDPVSTIRVQKP